MSEKKKVDEIQKTLTMLEFASGDAIKRRLRKLVREAWYLGAGFALPRPDRREMERFEEKFGFKPYRKAKP